MKMKRKNDEKTKNGEHDVPVWFDYMLVLCVAVFAILTLLMLMGPTIGNIFTNIGCLCLRMY